MTARICLAVALLLSPTVVLGGQNVVILLDDSGSMDERMRGDRRTRKIDAAKAALRTVLAKLPNDSQVGLVILNGPGEWLVPLGPVDRAGINQILDRIDAGGGTPLGRFMKVAADGLLAAREKERYGTYKLLIVTDGEAGDSELVERHLPDILSRGLVVDVIGVDMAQDHSLATKVQTYRRADDPQSLERAISEVVLGESTATGGDAGLSDFELLAGLPSEVASAALKALANQGNQPIGEQPGSLPPGAQIAQGPSGAGPSQTLPGSTFTVPPPQGRSPMGIVSTLLGGCCVVAVGVLVVLVALLRVAGRK